MKRRRTCYLLLRGMKTGRYLVIAKMLAVSVVEARDRFSTSTIWESGDEVLPLIQATLKLRKEAQKIHYIQG
ncbi:hypothetical protein ES703_41718 [subsurface metagenome]|nr:hypothetical protein [bacterium]